MISGVALQEFKELYLAEFGQEISDDEATELGANLLSIMDKVYRPVKQEWLDETLEESEINNTQIKRNESRIRREHSEEETPLNT